MRASASVLSDVRADRGTGLWFWFIVKVLLGISQMAGALWAAVLFVREGVTSRAIEAALLTAVVTSISLLLFKVLKWKPVKR